MKKPTQKTVSRLKARLDEEITKAANFEMDLYSCRKQNARLKAEVDEAMDAGYCQGVENTESRILKAIPRIEAEGVVSEQKRLVAPSVSEG